MDEAILKKTTIDHSKTLTHRFQITLKRALDVLLSVAGLILLSPIILLITIAIKIDSPGPVFYKHQRIGKNGKPFNLYKFRSMVSGGDDSSYMDYLAELIESAKTNNGRPYNKMEADPRVTRVGQFLRKSYLDELPQFWNILLGEMSLVGPRPHVQFEVDHYSENERRRLSVKPGATGIWQVHGKNDCTFRELIELDMEYVDRWSLGLDLKLIWRTILLMVSGGEGSWSRMAKIIPGKNIKPASGNIPSPSLSKRD
jgi:lipopolysaccharide/colanic/teichoic acid biosynthesis glycosyltransferase